MKRELHCFKLKENISRYRFGANLSVGFGGIFSSRLRDEKEREMIGESRAFFHLPGEWRRVSWRRKTARQKLSQGIQSTSPSLGRFYA